MWNLEDIESEDSVCNEDSDVMVWEECAVLVSKSRGGCSPPTGPASTPDERSRPDIPAGDILDLSLPGSYVPCPLGLGPDIYPVVPVSPLQVAEELLAMLREGKPSYGKDCPIVRESESPVDNTNSPLEPQPRPVFRHEYFVLPPATPLDYGQIPQDWSKGSIGQPGLEELDKPGFKAIEKLSAQGADELNKMLENFRARQDKPGSNAGDLQRQLLNELKNWIEKTRKLSEALPESNDNLTRILRDELKRKLEELDARSKKTGVDPEGLARDAHDQLKRYSELRKRLSEPRYLHETSTSGSK